MEIKTSTRGYELVGIGEGDESFARVYADYAVASHRNKIPFDHADGSVTDEKIGTRTVTDETGKSVTASLSEHLEGLYTAARDEITARSAAVAEEAAARKMADDTEKNERTAAISQEAQARANAITQEQTARASAVKKEEDARIAADDALSQSLNALSSAAVKTVNGVSPDSAGNVKVASGGAASSRTYRQCVVNGDFRRGIDSWALDTPYLGPCTLSAGERGTVVLTVPENKIYSNVTFTNVGKCGPAGEKNRYFIRVILSYTEDSPDGQAYTGSSGNTIPKFTMTKIKEFEIDGTMYGEYIGIAENYTWSSMKFMIAPFYELPAGEYKILEQIAVELPEGDELYDATAEELYGYFSEYAEGQYVL